MFLFHNGCDWIQKHVLYVEGNLDTEKEPQQESEKQATFGLELKTSFICETDVPCEQI